MNAKNNMLLALSCKQPPDFVPIWELEFQAWDNISGKHVILGEEFCGLSNKEKESAINNNAEILIETSVLLNFSALTTVNSYWEVSPGQPSYCWLPEEWKIKQNNLLLRECERVGIAAVGACGALISMPGTENLGGDSYEEFCYRIVDAPETIDEWVEHICNNGIEQAKMYNDMGYDIILSPSDIADNKGLFYSPEQMKRWFFPYLHKWAEAIKSMGMHSILHTDGNVSSILNDLANSPLDALQAIDPVAFMDIEKVKAQTTGKLCLCGNIETGLLMTGPVEAIYDETRKILANCKYGGGLILGASNAVIKQTPKEHYLSVIDAWHKYGQY